MNLTHLNHNNNPTMVDVSTKDSASREALASGKITMSKVAFLAVVENTNKKGPVIQTAVIAAIMAAKNTSQIIPMCHPLFISKVNVDIIPLEEECALRVESLVKCEGKTGVEMEALHSVSVGLLTIYDMLKAIDKSMLISDICLESKSGGKSGDYKRT
ncbi:cyclic pyranopterin monophosphate synthase MoaC [Helicobacter equorum]|uniref:cyclic pyranopterin monophosphate synthase MoaC n=1 Tax=Helicobacter equorum TaxID=361872 RepID=UPI000CF1291C|nr:cyclic pyranopterin monophosphate synthase MoaC [Helicobacter equorum]